MLVTTAALRSLLRVLTLLGFAIAFFFLSTSAASADDANAADEQRQGRALGLLDRVGDQVGAVPGPDGSSAEPEPVREVADVATGTVGDTVDRVRETVQPVRRTVERTLDVTEEPVGTVRDVVAGSTGTVRDVVVGSTDTVRDVVEKPFAPAPEPGPGAPQTPAPHDPKPAFDRDESPMRQGILAPLVRPDAALALVADSIVEVVPLTLPPLTDRTAVASAVPTSEGPAGLPVTPFEALDGLGSVGFLTPLKSGASLLAVLGAALLLPGLIGSAHARRRPTVMTPARPFPPGCTPD